jgi:hypothetical protein
VGYGFHAKSETRKLAATDAYLMYETGSPLVLQIHAGASFAAGDKALKQAHGKLYTAAALRYSFSAASASPVMVSPGLVAKSYVSSDDIRQSSFFLGAQIEFSYNTDK